MAGYVVQMVQKKTTCSACHEAVGSRQHKSESAFLTFKRQGKFFKPAESVIAVCAETERCFQGRSERLMNGGGGGVPLKNFRIAWNISEQNSSQYLV